MASNAEASGPAAGAGGPSGTGGDRVFLRKASGLIKTASTLDVAIFNIGVVSIGIGIAGVVLYGPSVYPGGNLPVGIIIAALAMSMIAFGMLTWTVTIPRSGGVYPFASRILPPPIAFMLSWVESLAWLFFCALAAYWVMTIGLIPMFTLLGTQMDSTEMADIATFLAKPAATCIGGIIVLLLAGGILGSGMRRYFLSQKIVITIATIGTLTMLIVLAVGSTDTFITNFDKAFGPDVTYRGVIATGKAGGWADPGGFDFGQTMQASNWAFLPLVGAAFSIAIGGEIKSGMRGQSVGMFAGVWVCTIFFLIGTALSTNVFGYDFLGTVGYNALGFNTSDAAQATPIVPWVTLLAGTLADSPFLTIVMSLGFIAWIWMWIPAMQSYGERAMIAWAFDRVAPGPLGKVSDRFHSPIAAIGVATVITAIFMYLFVYVSYFGTLVLFLLLGVLAWAVVLAAGCVFPFKRPDIYEKSPIANRKVLGLPLMTFACGLGFIAAAGYSVNLFLDEFAVNARGSRLIVGAGLFVSGLLFYYVMKLYRRSKGVDVDLAFKQIPIE